MMGDIPTIASASHAHSTYGLGNLLGGQNMFSGVTTAGQLLGYQNGAQQFAQALQAQNVQSLPVSRKPQEELKMSSSRRIVQVFIADPDENVPLDQSILYTSEQKLTDLNDQELFFEIDIKAILDEHNKKRIKLVDKKLKERVEHLEPARIRDLKMVVVTVATF